MSKSIDLGTASLAPASPVSNVEAAKSYPGVYLTLPADTKIPAEGSIEFKYRVVGIRRRPEQPTVNIDIELMSIEECCGREAVPSAGDAMDTYIKSMKECC